MVEKSTNHAVEVAEASWEDPEDAVLSGTYRVAAIGDEWDHLVVYIRGAGGDPEREYKANRTICGKEFLGGVRRVSEACVLCLDGAGRAFMEARELLAGRWPDSAVEKG